MLLALSERQATALLGAPRRWSWAVRPPARSPQRPRRLGIGAWPSGDSGSRHQTFATLSTVPPRQLAAELTEAEQVTTAIELLAVMALVDGALDGSRLPRCSTSLTPRRVTPTGSTTSPSSRTRPRAGSCGHGCEEPAQRHRRPGRLRLVDDVNHWLLPYDGGDADPDLAARYPVARGGPPGSLGHDSGLSTTAITPSSRAKAAPSTRSWYAPRRRTVLSASTRRPRAKFDGATSTSRIHPVFPMAGHVLPVIYSWHLGIEFNKLAGSYTGALDPAKFFVASDAGCARAATPLVPLRLLGARRRAPRTNCDAFGTSATSTPPMAPASGGARTRNRAITPLRNRLSRAGRASSPNRLGRRRSRADAVCAQVEFVEAELVGALLPRRCASAHCSMALRLALVERISRSQLAADRATGSALNARRSPRRRSARLPARRNAMARRNASLQFAFARPRCRRRRLVAHPAPRVGDEAAHRAHDLRRIPVGPDEAGVGVHRRQRRQREHVHRGLQVPLAAAGSATAAAAACGGGSS